MPTVQSGGTVTRRTLVPCKRSSQTDTMASSNYNELNNSDKYENTGKSYNNNNNNNRSIKQNSSPTKMKSNSISVGGVSGLRLLRGQKSSDK